MRAPWHTTVCGSVPAMASRRTVSREIPSRWASCAAVRKSAACSVSNGGGCRGGGMSAAARARATASSSSAGTGRSVLWWLFSVLGFVVGSCRRGLAPWVILVDGPGGLFVPGFARAHCHGDGTPIRPGASGTKAVADVPPGISRYPVSRLIYGRASSAGSGMPGAGLPHMQDPCTTVRSQPGHAGPVGG